TDHLIASGLLDVVAEALYALAHLTFERSRYVYAVVLLEFAAADEEDTGCRFDSAWRGICAERLLGVIEKQVLELCRASQKNHVDGEVTQRLPLCRERRERLHERG